MFAPPKILKPILLVQKDKFSDHLQQKPATLDDLNAILLEYSKREN